MTSIRNMRRMNGNRKSLLKNSISLYILLFSSYFFGFIIIPYQTRVLGPELFGRIGFALAVMVFFQLLVDFGFILSATAAISKNRHDLRYLNKLFTAINIAKVLLSLISVLILSIIFGLFPKIAADWQLYSLFLIATIASSMLPDYLYRGLEKMTPMTVRIVSIRFIFLLMTFIFLKEPDDYYKIPLLLSIGNIIALAWAYWDVSNRFNVRFSMVTPKYVKSVIIESSYYFYSRIASTLYGALNVVTLGIVSPGPTVGYYVASNKFITTAQSAMMPISDSLYPYMINNKDYKLIKKILKLCTPFIFTFGILGFIYAQQICIIVFGQAYSGASNILRASIPIAILALPTYLLGFPTLGAMGYAKHANYSIYCGALVQLTLLTLLIATSNVTAVTLAMCASISELVVFLYRLFAVRRLYK